MKRHKHLDLALDQAIKKDFERRAITFAELVVKEKEPLSRFHLVPNDEFIQRFNELWDEYAVKN